MEGLVSVFWKVDLHRTLSPPQASRWGGAILKGTGGLPAVIFEPRGTWWHMVISGKLWNCNNTSIEGRLLRQYEESSYIPCTLFPLLFALYINQGTLLMTLDCVWISQAFPLLSFLLQVQIQYAYYISCCPFWCRFKTSMHVTLHVVVLSL